MEQQGRFLRCACDENNQTGAFFPAMGDDYVSSQLFGEKNA